MMFSVLSITAVRSLEEWVPTLPPWPDTVRLEAISVERNAYVKVAMEFPTGGYDVNWGSVTRIDDSTFSADAEIWVWTGPVIMMTTGASHVYDLGALPPGVYEFIFKTWGVYTKSLQFVHPPELENTLKLEALYSVSLDFDFWLDNGSKLVVKFYTWGGAYEGENVVWTGSTPDNVSFSKVVSRPKGKAVEKAKLDLTTDNTANEISTIASFIVTKNDLFGRVMAIKGEWPIASDDERNAIFNELMDIKGQWPIAPS